MLARAKAAWKWIDATDTALSWIDRLLRVFGASAGLGLIVGAIAWLIQNFYAAVVVGLVVWLFAIMGLLARAALRVGPPETGGVEAKSSASVHSSPAPVMSEPYPRVRDEEVPQLLETRWVQGRTIQIEQFVRHRAYTLRNDVHVRLNHMTFMDCQIYGPALLAPAKSVVSPTFVDCTWDEEPWQRWRASYKEGYYVGAITVADCVFRNCHFRGVGLVMDPDEYDEKMAGYKQP